MAGRIAPGFYTRLGSDVIAAYFLHALQQESDWSVCNATRLLSNYHKTTVTQLIGNLATGCSACIIRPQTRSAAP